MSLLFIIGMMILHDGSDAASDISPIDPLASVIRSMSDFAGNFYQNLANNTADGNLICSPIGVSMVLSMLVFGARGNTKLQLDRALSFSKNEAIEKEGFKLLIDELNGYTVATVDLAYKIYLSNHTIDPKPEFTEVLKNTFNSSLTMLDFEQSEESSDIINKWVEDKTYKRIGNITKPDDVNKDTALVLVSAVYFKGKWVVPFNPENTSEMPFWVNGITQKNRMSMYLEYDYYSGELEDVDARFVELPYKSENTNDSTSMFIILPNKKNGLKRLEENFDKITVQRLINESRYHGRVHITLPKFRIESEVSLEQPLRQMGLTSMFDKEAEFTGIASSPPLYVSKIKQKVFIEIDEWGTEAAGVYYAALTYISADFVEFRADHPFMGIIATKSNIPVNLFTFRYTGEE